MGLLRPTLELLQSTGTEPPAPELSTWDVIRLDSIDSHDVPTSECEISALRSTTNTRRPDLVVAEVSYRELYLCRASGDTTGAISNGPAVYRSSLFTCTALSCLILFRGVVLVRILDRAPRCTCAGASRRRCFSSAQSVLCPQNRC